MASNIEKVQNLAAAFIQQAGLLNDAIATPGATIAANNALVVELHKEIKGALPEMREANSRRTLEIIFQMAIVAMQKGAIHENTGSTLVQTLSSILTTPKKAPQTKLAKRSANTARSATLLHLSQAPGITPQTDLTN